MVGECHREAVAHSNTLDRLAGTLVGYITVDVVGWDFESTNDFKVIEADLLGLSAYLNLEVAIGRYIVDAICVALPLRGVDNLVESNLLTPKLVPSPFNMVTVASPLVPFGAVA